MFSPGQVDVFFDKCYQSRNGWAFIEGQGQLEPSVITAVMELTNLVLIHFHKRDLKGSQDQVDKLIDTVRDIRKQDRTVHVCILIRDANETVILEPK